MWKLVFPILAYVLFAAHLLFHGLGLLASASVLIPIALLGFRCKFVIYGQMVLLTLVGVEWLRTSWVLVEVRMSYGLDWMLATVILTVCALWSFLSVWIVYQRKL